MNSTDITFSLLVTIKEIIYYSIIMKHIYRIQMTYIYKKKIHYNIIQLKNTDRKIDNERMQLEM